MIAWVIAALGGAGLMYLLDPVTGRNRRKLVREKVGKYASELNETRQNAIKEVENKAQEITEEVRDRLQQTPATDETINTRVRTEIARHIATSYNVSADVKDGQVTLSGTIPASKIEPLVEAVRAVPDVKDVVNNLEVRGQTHKMPDVQNSTPRSNEP